MTTNDNFDSLLDDALAEYREAEPLAGLEERVLRCVQDRPPQRRAWPAWSLAAALVMALLAAGVWFEFRDPPYQPLPTYHASAEQPAAQPTPNVATGGEISDLWKLRPNYPEKFPVAVSSARRTPSSLSRSHNRQSSDQFPAPAPLTSEERALLALADSNPEALRTLPAGKQELAIAPITIQPLTDGSGSNEGDN